MNFVCNIQFVTLVPIYMLTQIQIRKLNHHNYQKFITLPLISVTIFNLSLEMNILEKCIIDFVNACVKCKERRCFLSEINSQIYQISQIALDSLFLVYRQKLRMKNSLFSYTYIHTSATISKAYSDIDRVSILLSILWLSKKFTIEKRTKTT